MAPFTVPSVVAPLRSKGEVDSRTRFSSVSKPRPPGRARTARRAAEPANCRNRYRAERWLRKRTNDEIVFTRLSLVYLEPAQPPAGTRHETWQRRAAATAAAENL